MYDTGCFQGGFVFDVRGSYIDLLHLQHALEARTLGEAE